MSVKTTRSLPPSSRRRRVAAIRLVALALLAAPIGMSIGAARGSAQVPTPPTWAGAEAVTAAIGSPPRPIDGSPYAAVPPGGGSITDAAAATTVGGVGTVELPGVSANGGPVGGSGGTATTTMTAWRVSLFGGRVQASDIRVSATATLANGQARVDGDVTFEELVVDGVAYPAPALNQSIPLPGIGTLLVRERRFANFGAAAATVFVRAFHVVATDGGMTGLPGGGEVVVGAATAGVPDVALLPPSVLTTSALATPRQYVAISTRAPIDTSIRTSLVGNDNFSFDNENGNSNGNQNGNDNQASSTATATPRATTGTTGSQQVVVTVVVIVQPGGPTPTATPTRTP